MAARLELAFGEPARKLLDMQSAWDSAQPKRSHLTPVISSYVPPFLQLKAAKIEAWAGTGISPRHRLSVFLRTLVNSTSTGLSKVNFPGNDDSERPGWDGEIEADEATPWVPKGRSGWEFGVNQDPKGKADGRSEEHTSELQSLMRISYAAFCVKEKKQTQTEQRQ